MNSNQPIAIEHGDGIDIAAIWHLMWKFRLLIGITTILFALLAVFLALTATQIFRAEVIVTEVHDNGISGGSGLAGQLGGLANLAGLNLTGGSVDDNASGVLTSRHLVEEFVKKQGLKPVLMANAGKPATLWFAVKQFQDTIVEVHEDARKGMTSITMDWTEPAVAAKWANDFVALANELVRARAIEDSTRNVAYLKEQLLHTSSVEIQRSMYSQIESETKTLMLANARHEYAFRVIDPAVAPEIRYSPKRTLMVLAGTAIGFLVGAMLAFGFNAFGRRKTLQ